MNNMNVYGIVLLLIVSTWKARSLAEPEYMIYRWRRDPFRIPDLYCSNNTVSQCNMMGGKQRTRNKVPVECTCHCKYNDTQNVFGFFDGTWKCARNVDVRQYSGCSLKVFTDNTKSGLLSYVNPSSSKAKEVGKIITNESNCSLETKFSYLECNSSWTEILYGNSFNGFKLQYFGKDTQMNHNWEIHISKRSTLQDFSAQIYGRIIKLNIKCTDDGLSYLWYCVIFKVGGTLRCPIISKTATSPPSTTVPASTTFSSTSTQATSIYISTPEETTVTATTMTEKAASPSFHWQTTVNTSKSTNTTNIPRETGRNSASTSDNGGMIAGAIGGVAVLATILVILLVIWRKRHLITKRTASDRADNPAYDCGGDRTQEINGQLAFTDDEYSYAYTNNHPIVIKDQNGNALKAPGNSNRLSDNTKGAPGSPTKYQAPVYNTLENPDDAKLTTSQDIHNGPSYNVLQRPENKWQTKQGPVYDVLEDRKSAVNSTQNPDGPVYNTLEDPNYAKLDKAKHSYSEPSYNVLERPESKWPTKQGPVYDVLEVPDSNVAPVYDVLEGPESDDQHVYGSLENQDPHIYGALNSPTSASGVAFSGYDDVLYDSTGDVIQSGDIYQELNQAGQQSPNDVYQPLRHPRKSMVMKNMSGVTQSHA